MEKIFVQIASYRDPECQWTLKDLFEKAKHPERLFVGLCLQYDPQQDQHCFQITPPRQEQTRLLPFHWREGRGACWARHHLQRLWQGEEYVLAIDSHMRFEQDWDETLIRMLNECPSEKPLLTAYGSRYTPPNNLETNFPTNVLIAKPYTDFGDIRVTPIPLRNELPQHTRGAFVSANFHFARSSFITDVPYDPDLYFDEEEVSLSARAYTHGYDVYHPTRVVVYHLYRDADNTPTKRTLHWADEQEWQTLRARARMRMDHLMGSQVIKDPFVLRDIEKYGMGTVRSLDQFAEFCGVDFKRKIATERCVMAQFIEGIEQHITLPDYVSLTERLTKVQKQAQQQHLTPEQVKAAEAAAVTRPPTAQQQYIQAYERRHPRVTAQTPLLALRVPMVRASQAIEVEKDTPPGILVIRNFIDRDVCTYLSIYARSQTATDLGVIRTDETLKTGQQTSTLDQQRITKHVPIDGISGEVIGLFSDIYARRISMSYNADIEWFERPQLLRYDVGGRYNPHADSEGWSTEKQAWIRSATRDFSAILYLNEEFQGGDLVFVQQKYVVKPRAGTLVFFPSDHRYIHAALPVTAGMRFALVTWGAAVGSPRPFPMPYGSIVLHQQRVLLHKMPTIEEAPPAARSTPDERSQLVALRKGCQQLAQERDFLSRVTAYYTQQFAATQSHLVR